MAEKEISRREFLKKSAILGTGIVVGGTVLNKTPGEGSTNQPVNEAPKEPGDNTVKVEVVTSPENKVEEQTIEWLPDEVMALWPTIQVEADKFKLDPRIIAIIITEESGGKNIANNEGSGAMGPMQLMPIAMQEYARRSVDKQLREITNPADNIHVGCWLINDINKHYIEPAGVDLYSDLGILMLAVGYGDGIGTLRNWQRSGMNPNQLSEQAKNVSRIWTGMWHEKGQSSSPTLNAERGYNT